jgi:hypothetical protein
VATRIIDVSRAAAEQLDMLVTGLAPVIIEAIGTTVPETPVQPDPFAFTPPPPVPQPPIITQPAPQLQFFPQPAPQPQVFIPAPQPQFFPTPPPVQTPPPAAAPPPPATIFTADTLHITQFAPPPVQQPIPESPAAHHGPITVTVFPPAYAQPQIQSPIPQQQVTPIPEQLPPQISQGARLVPAINTIPGRSYTLQVGSFRIASNAVDAYVRLQRAGLSPEYERFGDLYRVIMKGVLGEDVQAAAVKIEQAGFNEALIRLE